jgi:hypothetical protein
VLTVGAYGCGQTLSALWLLSTTKEGAAQLSRNPDAAKLIESLR